MTIKTTPKIEPYSNDGYNVKFHHVKEQAEKSGRASISYSGHDEGEHLHILCKAVAAAGWPDDYVLNWGNKRITATRPGFKAAPKPKQEKKKKAVRNMPRLLVGKNREGI